VTRKMERQGDREYEEQEEEERQMVEQIQHQELSEVSLSGSQSADPHPPPPLYTKAGRNNLNEEINPLLPTGIGEGYSQTISNLGHATLLCRCELPL
jgi:hypothetical protein